MSTLTEPAERSAAAWDADDDWTDEALKLLRDIRTPHRRKRAGQFAYALYCVLLVLVVWGALPSLGLFMQASMGADYTGHGPAVLAAIPAGSCAVGLGWLLLAARDALWRGPVVPTRESVDWLLAQPVRVGRVLRPWWWASAVVVTAAGLLVAAIAMVALGLTVRVGLPAAFGWSLPGAVGLPLLALGVATAVERGERAARWARALTPFVALAVLALLAQCVLAVAGHRVGWLERAELWSGPWGWAGLAALSPTPAAVSGGWVALALLVVVAGGAVTLAARAVGGLALSQVRWRSRTATGVMTALRTAELRTARLTVSAATGGGRPVRGRLPVPRRAALVVPWRDATALLRLPGRVGRSLVLAALAVLGAVVAAGAHGSSGVVTALAALAFAYWSVTQLLEPARVETDDTRRGSWAPYPYRDLMLRHTVVPAAVGLLFGAVAAGVLLVEGAGARAALAPAVVPPMVAAALVNACRGVTRHHLLVQNAQSAVGGPGPVLFLGWYCAGGLAAVAALAVPFTVALHRASGAAVLTAVVADALVTAVMLRWTVLRVAKLTA
jgi:hypothetical protein